MRWAPTGVTLHVIKEEDEADLKISCGSDVASRHVMQRDIIRVKETLAVLELVVDSTSRSSSDLQTDEIKQFYV
jgi:hypothetical protein